MRPGRTGTSGVAGHLAGRRGGSQGAQQSILGSHVQRTHVRKETGQPLKVGAVAMTVFDDAVSEGPSLAVVESCDGW